MQIFSTLLASITLAFLMVATTSNALTITDLSRTGVAARDGSTGSTDVSLPGAFDIADFAGTDAATSFLGAVDNALPVSGPAGGLGLASPLSSPAAPFSRSLAARKSTISTVTAVKRGGDGDGDIGHGNGNGNGNDNLNANQNDNFNQNQNQNENVNINVNNNNNNNNNNNHGNGNDNGFNGGGMYDGGNGHNNGRHNALYEGNDYDGYNGGNSGNGRGYRNGYRGGRGGRYSNGYSNSRHGGNW